ncbi:MAG: hypothetical protein ABSG41_12295 [Bryobacteraceae bacterium]|jgi:hypothetical protein
MRAARLGDDIDDFCVKCKRVMNHAVVSILKDEPAKVRCRTCHSDHDFRHEQAPPPKVDARKAALFSQVLANVTSTQEPVAAGIADDPSAAVDSVDATAPDVEAAAPDVEAAAPAKAPTRAKSKASKKAKA